MQVSHWPMGTDRRVAWLTVNRSLAGKRTRGEDDSHTLSPAQTGQAETALLHRAGWGRMSQAQL